MPSLYEYSKVKGHKKSIKMVLEVAVSGGGTFRIQMNVVSTSDEISKEDDELPKLL